MYEAHFGLLSRPFAVVPDPSFIYWTGPHRLAVVMLEYGILSHAGFTVITGEVGAGKTTLIRHLLPRLPGDVDVRVISSMQGGRGELLEWVLMAFDQPFDGGSYVTLYKRLRSFLERQHEQGRRTVLIIDEAQHLGPESLEQLRMISNVNTVDEELLQIVLCGQPELKQLLAGPEMRQFVQRVSSDFHLSLLQAADVPAYIDHRLAVAGASRQLFTAEASELVAGATQGTPRLINILCDTALLYGFAVGAPIITPDIVARVLEDKRQYGVFPLATAG
jgi:type II secretory pathway predicted ATPase ExeA